MHANPRKTTSVKPLGQLDVAALAEQVLAIPEAVWDAEDAAKPNKFETLGRTRHIVFRFVDNTDDWRRSHDRALWAEWRSRLEPVMRQAVAPYGYANSEFPRVMLARMAPGGIIEPHIDSAPAATWPHKVHVPIQTNPEVKFFIDPAVYHFSVGAAVEVNNLGLHAVRNDGASDRIHLIFEYYDRDQPSWLDAIP